MDNLFEKIFLYDYHDTSINQIIIDDKITLIFENGIYASNENGDKQLLTGKAYMNIFVSDNKYMDTIEDFDNRKGLISLKKFNKKLKNYIFEVFNLYYSCFCNMILIEGNFINDYKAKIGVPNLILIYIYNCTDIDFKFDDK